MTRSSPPRWCVPSALLGPVVAVLAIGAAVSTGAGSPGATALPRAAAASAPATLVSPAARPAGQAAPSSAATPALTLLQQSTWVADNQLFRLRLGVGPGVAAADRIVVTAYPRLTNRTDFDLAADGRLGQNPGAVWIGEESVAEAPPAGGGGGWARIPVDAALGAGDLQTQQAFDPGGQSGVYPLQIQLVGADYTAVGRAISTFLVYSAGQAAFPPLLTSLTVPVAADLALSPTLVPSPLPAPASAALSKLSSVLAEHPTVPLTLAVNPMTAASLATGPAADRATLSRLRTRLHGGDELLPAPYAPVSPAALAGSGLADQLAPQLQEGRALLGTTLGATPDSGTWVLNGPIDDATLQLLQGDGLRRLIVADTALTPLPARLVNMTYGRPTHLEDGSGTLLSVFGTDPTLASRVTHTANPVLAAEQTLAELAMIELETPSLRRGVAISIPGRAQLSLPFLETLLNGLRDNPFVRPVTAAGLLAGVPTLPPQAQPATSPSLGSKASAAGGAVSSPEPTRRLLPVSVALIPSFGTIQVLDTERQGLLGLLPADTALTDQLGRQLLVAPAAGLSASRREALLAAMAQAVKAAEAIVRLPGDTSVTLTSLKATLPLIVISDAKLSPHVRIVLASPKLGFRAFRPPDGSCQVVGRTSEVCDMVLHGPETVLRVPVVSRTSGVFSLDVSITSPDGSLTLAVARDTVRSTAVSSVGIVIIVVSLLFLGIWWIRNIHSGRRARQLVQRPGDDIDDGDDDNGPPGGGIEPRPPSHPVGPSEPTEPRRVTAPAVTVGEPSVLVGRRHRQPHQPAHRAPHDPRRARDAPTEHPELSPSKRVVGLIGEDSLDLRQERSP